MNKRLAYALLSLSLPIVFTGCGHQEEKIVAEAPVEMISMGGYINEVTQSMADQLIRNTDIMQFSQNPVAITSFVNLEDFDETNRVGEIVAENMVHELQVRGHRVVDFKMTPYIRVTPEGDFVRSREVEELARKQNINIILTGTYVYHNDGLVINARMIDLESSVVLSSAQGSVPGWFVDDVTSMKGRTLVAEESGIGASSSVPDHNSEEQVGAAPGIGFSKDLQDLDSILFSDMPVETAEDASSEVAAVTEDGGDTAGESLLPTSKTQDRYLCSPEGICFDRFSNQEEKPSEEG